MALTADSCTPLLFLAGVSTLLIIKAEIKNSTRTNADARNATVMYAKQGKTNLTEGHAMNSSIKLPLEKTSPKEFLANNAPLTHSVTKRVPSYSTMKTLIAGYKLVSNASTILGNHTFLISSTSTTTVSIQTTASTSDLETSTNNSKSSLANSDICDQTNRKGLMICFIIIAVLVLLCTFLLIATVVLANQVSYLKSTLLSKRQTRNNGDFLTISSGFWPNGSDKWMGSQLLKGPNLSMGDLPINGGTNTKGHLSKNRSKESSEKSMHEQDAGSNISLDGHDDS